MRKMNLLFALLTFSLAWVTPPAGAAGDVAAGADFMRQLDEIDQLYQKHDADSADAQLERVLSAVRAAAERTPKDVVVQRALGRALAFHGDASDALAARAAVISLAPDNADAWFELGQSQVQSEQTSDALLSFEKAAALNPGHAKASLMAGAMLARDGKDDQALAWFKKAADADPKYALAHSNVGQIYQNQGKFAESLAAYQTAASLTPEDGRIWAKIVQNFQALGKTKERDAARNKLMALHKAGTIREPFYCREQFMSGTDRVMAFEYFELRGDRAVRYSFNVIPAGDSKPSYRISLGSYESATEMAREQGEIKPGERMFHLDGDYPAGEHRTYAVYKVEPTYEEARVQTVSAIEGKLKPVSSATRGEIEN